MVAEYAEQLMRIVMKVKETLDIVLKQQQGNDHFYLNQMTTFLNITSQNCLDHLLNIDKRHERILHFIKTPLFNRQLEKKVIKYDFLLTIHLTLCRYMLYLDIVKDQRYPTLQDNTMIDKILDAIAYTIIAITAVYGVYFYGTELIRIISENI